MSYSFEGISEVIFHNPLIPSPDVRLWADGETGGSPLKLIISHGGLDTNANTGQLKCPAATQDDGGGGICLTNVTMSQHFITMTSLQSTNQLNPQFNSQYPTGTKDLVLVWCWSSELCIILSCFRAALIYKVH